MAQIVILELRLPASSTSPSAPPVKGEPLPLPPPPISASFLLAEGGRLHLPTVGLYFGLRPGTLTLDGVVHAADLDGSGLTLTSFHEGNWW